MCECQAKRMMSTRDKAISVVSSGDASRIVAASGQFCSLGVGLYSNVVVSPCRFNSVSRGRQVHLLIAVIRCN